VKKEDNMEKNVFITIFAALFFLSCTNDTPKNDNELDNNISDVLPDEDTEELDEIDNEEPDYDYTHSDPGPVWIDPDYDWKSWTNLDIRGVISNYEGDHKPAVRVIGKMKLSDIYMEFSDGAFSLYKDSLIFAEAYSFEVINVNTDSTAVLDYWETAFYFSRQLIPFLEEYGSCEAGFGANVVFKHSFIDIEYDNDGNVKKQQIRKNCYVAVSKTEEIEEEGEIYNIPIGDMCVSSEEGAVGSVGENLRMMFKNEMIDTQNGLLKYFNKRSDGTVAIYGDEDFMHLCQCYDVEGNEVNCWEYDGPGGAEECPDYVPQEDCKLQGNDEDVVIDEDVVPDEDAA